MKVGFTIIGSSISQDNRDSVIDFISSNFILPEKSVAENIVSTVMKGSDVSIYGDNIDYTKLDAQPFGYTAINVTEGKFLVVSAVDFKLELAHNGSTIILLPTENMEVSYEDALTFGEEVEQGLVRIIPSLSEANENWILFGHDWNDSDVWADEQTWKD